MNTYCACVAQRTCIAGFIPALSDYLNKQVLKPTKPTNGRLKHQRRPLLLLYNLNVNYLPYTFLIARKAVYYRFNDAVIYLPLFICPVISKNRSITDWPRRHKPWTSIESCRMCDRLSLAFSCFYATYTSWSSSSQPSLRPLPTRRKTFLEAGDNVSASLARSFGSLWSADHGTILRLARRCPTKHCFSIQFDESLLCKQ